MKSVVGRQVISDVTVGCQLSGGIDSSIITKIVSEEHRLYDTVSCKVSTDNQSDAEYIDLVNVKLGAKSHIRHIDENVFMNNIIDAVWHFDGALSHTPSIGMLEISRCANENNIEVLLSGEGADELFGGYKYFSQLANNAARLSADEIDQAIVFRDGM